MAGTLIINLILMNISILIHYFSQRTLSVNIYSDNHAKYIKEKKIDYL
jgi:hypothetical protein